MYQTNNPARNRMDDRTLFFIVPLIIAVFVLAIWGFGYHHIQPASGMTYLVSTLLALIYIGLIVNFGLYLAEEKDEFIRNAQVQSLLGGMGLTLALVSVWGFLENFVHVGRLDLFLVYPIFWGFVGLSTIVVWLKNR